MTPESADRAGYTSIHAAASYGHIPLLRFLIKDRNGDINVQDLEGDTPLHMCELVDVAREMIVELGADVTLKNHEGLTAAEAVREEGDFDDLADYLESVTPGVVRNTVDNSGLAYTEFRDEDDEGSEWEDEESKREERREVPRNVAERIDELLRLEEEDGVNQDDELRNIVTEVIMGQIRQIEVGRGRNQGGTRPGRNES
jgi:uncharacterized protein